MKNFLETIFFSVTVHIDGRFLWPPPSPDLTFTHLYVWGHPQGMFTPKNVNTRGDCCAATTTRRKPGNSQAAMNVGVTVPSYTLTHVSNFTHRFHHQVVAQYFCIYYYTQLLHVSAINPSHFQGVTSFVDGNTVHGQLS
jgi:hypothetical protein